MSLFRKKKYSNEISPAEKEWIKKSFSNERKSYVIAVIHKKNKKLKETIVELDNEIVIIDKTPHYAGDDSIFFKSVKLKNNKYDIPKVDVYEGSVIAVHPCKDIYDIKFSKRVVDMIGLKIEQGVLESKRRKKMDMRKIIMAVLIGIAAIIIFSKMF